MGDTLQQNGAGPYESANAKCKVHSEFVAPPPEFDGCFTTFYFLNLEVEDGGRVRDYLQPEWGNIRFFVGSPPIARIDDTSVSGFNFTATGPSSRPCEFSVGTAKMWGIGFLPLGWARFIDVPASELANIVTDGASHKAFQKFSILNEVLCDENSSQSEQVEAICSAMRSLMRPNRDEPKIIRVHKALLDSQLSSVGQFADQVGMSVRTLERICARYFGFPPKLLLRRQRFMRSLTSFMLHRNANWTDAMDEHYHDQAHFTREFREFMTMNPTEYANMEIPILSAFMEARARIWGSAAQTLDKPDRR